MTRSRDFQRRSRGWSDKWITNINYLVNSTNMEEMNSSSCQPLGRPAADLISIYKRFISSCEPLDRLLGDGLPSGHILELSGPPGTAKESLVVKFVSNAVSSNDQVLFIGRTQDDYESVP